MKALSASRRERLMAPNNEVGEVSERRRDPNTTMMAARNSDFEVLNSDQSETCCSSELQMCTILE
jgi:hypothetical protein